jgi:glutathione S-transferase/RNA polymerase-associated protein
MLRLYEHPLSPYVRKVKIVLNLKGIPYERIYLNPTAPDPATLAAFTAVSPLLEVPALVHGELALFDSTVMLEYVDERWPSPPALPETAAERARVRMLEELCDTQLEAVNWGLMEIRFFKRVEGARAEEMVARARKQLDRYLGRLERELAGRSWMNGERFGRGDAAAYPHVVGSSFWGVALDAKQHPRLAEWLARCADQPAVKQDSEQVSAWIRDNLGPSAGATPSMPIVRQYRDHRLEWMMRTGGVDVVLRGLENGTIRFQTEF